MQALKDNVDVFETSLTHQTAALNNRLKESDLLLQQTGNEIRTSIQTASQKREDLCDYARRFEYALSSIIASLKFPGMDDRFECVADAHASTFSWVFESKTTSDQPWDSFTSWLEQENGDHIYWVSGKAASGKSTLMRYIFENKRKLGESLDTWRQGRPLMTPNFFFWSIGTAMQKSQNGLFRSLLHQILSQDRNLVQEVLPELVRSTLSLPFDQLSRLEEPGPWRVWSLNELKQTFFRLIKQETTSTCYCFLIDGLDEYDGDYLELLTFFKVISACSNVKLCLSSRPLLAFEDCFNKFPKLRLQDLTIGDIYTFVRGRLEEHPRFYALAQREPQESLNLISEIVHTSCGVFLWVSLVVKSLLEGLTNHDGLSDLQKRLRALPPELEGLYSTMLNSISPPFYLEQASRLLQLVYQSPSPLNPAGLSFADDEDQELAIKTKIGPITSSEFERRTKAMILRLKSRCAGLLEVQVTGRELSGYVQYLHLTVREYLEKPDVWTRLLELTKSSGFDASVSLFRSKLLMLKVINSPEDIRRHAEGIIPIALQAEESTGKAQTALLRALATTVSQLTAGYSLCHRFIEGGLPCDCCPDSILTFAVRNGLTLFVRDSIRRCRGLKQSYGERSLLDYATWYQPGMKSADAQPSMVAMLFGEGLRPNDASHGSTPWRALLRFLAEEASFRRLPNAWIDVCKLFVLSGADVKAGCEVRDKWRSTWDVLKSAFRNLPGESLQELERMVLDRGGGRNLMGPPQLRNKHYQNRLQNRGYGFQRNPNHRAQDLYGEDRTVVYDRFGTTQYPGNRAGHHGPRNAEQSNQDRNNRHSPRYNSSRRSFAQVTEYSTPSMQSQSRRWQPY